MTLPLSRLACTDSIRSKLQRAEEHLRDLNVQIGECNPYKAIRHEDSKTGNHELRLWETDCPPRLLAVLGDTIHNLRCVLDHFACALVAANGGTITDNTGFPVSYTLEHFESTAIRKIDGASGEAIAFIKSLKPYKGGNDLLWALHRLDIIDKHRFFITIASVNTAITIKGGPLSIDCFFPDDTSLVRTLPAARALKNGAVLFRINRAQMPPMYVDPEFRFQIAFGEVLEGQPVLAGVYQIAAMVKRIVSQATS